MIYAIFILVSRFADHSTAEEASHYSSADVHSRLGWSAVTMVLSLLNICHLFSFSFSRPYFRSTNDTHNRTVNNDDDDIRPFGARSSASDSRDLDSKISVGPVARRGCHLPALPSELMAAHLVNRKVRSGGHKR